MCRLFGFRSVTHSSVTQSLIKNENALMLQSEKHPDGWGLAYYLNNIPHLLKSTHTALSDALFQEVSGVLTAKTVLAHIRKATVGPKTIVNTHPFQHGPWTFAHNGTIGNMDKKRDKIISLINPNLKKFVFGQTDSELIFYVLLSALAKTRDLYQHEFDFSEILISLQTGMTTITEAIGPLEYHSDNVENGNYITYLLTNGSIMIAFHGGRPLHFSTYKKACADRNICPFLSWECENPPQNGHINYLIVSSEPLDPHNIWHRVKPGHFVGTDSQLNFFHLASQPA